MNHETSSKKHWAFWVIGILGLLWNIGGAGNYLMQTNVEFVNAMPATHQAIIVGRPAWATGGFALGVFGGALGCFLLLLTRRVSVYVLIASLIGIVVTMVHTTNIVMSDVEFSWVEIFMMMILPVVVALGLLAYARHAMHQYAGK